MQGSAAGARALPRAAHGAGGRGAQPPAPCARSAPRRAAHGGACLLHGGACLARQRLRLHAVRKGAPPASAEGDMDAAQAASWAAFADAVVPDGRDPSGEGLTPEFKAAVNLMCNRSLKAMLKEDRAEVAELRGEVAALVQHFNELDPATARFLRVILSMLSNELPERGELLRLREDYAVAFDSMWALLEDAGWALLPVGEDS